MCCRHHQRYSTSTAGSTIEIVGNESTGNSTRAATGDESSAAA
jgi:hypothetical protein